MIAVKAWINVVKILFYGFCGILWNRICDGDDREGVMVSAALVFRSTGKLWNAPQVVNV